MTEHHARADLHLEVGERGSLCLGEAAHLRGGGVDVPRQLGGPLRAGAVDVGVGDAEVGRIPAVEPRGPLAHRLLAASRDVVEDLRDGAHDLRAGLRDVVAAALQVPSHADPTRRRERSAARSSTA